MISVSKVRSPRGSVNIDAGTANELHRLGILRYNGYKVIDGEVTVYEYERRPDAEAPTPRES